MNTSAPPKPRMHDRIRERRRTVVKERVRRRRRAVGSALVLALLAGGAVALTYTPLFAVTDVRVEGVSGEQEQLVRDAAGVLEGERLLGVDLRAITAAVEVLPWVRHAEVRRQAPSTIGIDVEPRRPVAVVHTGDAAWIVDAEGVVIGGGTDDAVARVDVPGADIADVGERVTDPAAANAIAVHTHLPLELRAQVVRYDAPSVRGLRLLLAGDAVTDLAEDGVWVRIGAAERLDAKVRVIGLLLEQLREEADRLGGAPIAELDVRAPDNPVVVPGP